MQENTESTQFEQLAQALARAKATAEPSEVHGILCGMICATGRADMNTWLDQVLGDHDPRDSLVKETQTMLMDLHDTTLKQFTDKQFGLTLLLNKDDAPIENRIEDLGMWCQGFILGMTISGIRDITKLPNDAGEIMRDIIEISQAGYEPDQDEEENESAYTEVVEYIRVGALVIYDELNQLDNEQSEPTIH